MLNDEEDEGGPKSPQKPRDRSTTHAGSSTQQASSPHQGRHHHHHVQANTPHKPQPPQGGGINRQARSLKAKSTGASDVDAADLEAKMNDLLKTPVKSANVSSTADSQSGVTPKKAPPPRPPQPVRPPRPPPPASLVRATSLDPVAAHTAPTLIPETRGAVVTNVARPVSLDPSILLETPDPSPADPSPPATSDVEESPLVSDRASSPSPETPSSNDDPYASDSSEEDSQAVEEDAPIVADESFPAT